MDEQKKHNQPSFLSDALKSWMMIALTLIFVGLYAAALFGLIEPLKDISVVSRVEPIIFVIIGYYFGRLPAQAAENTLKTEINRQTQKADAAQQIKERTQQEREILEEKIRNAKISLSPPNKSAAQTKDAATLIGSAEQANHAIETAVRILDS